MSNRFGQSGRAANGNHFVCKVEIDVTDAPVRRRWVLTSVSTTLRALAYEDGHSELYPLNCLKQDDYYFSKRIAQCDNSNSEQATRLNHKKSARRTHYFPHSRNTSSNDVLTRKLERS